METTYFPGRAMEEVNDQRLNVVVRDYVSLESYGCPEDAFLEIGSPEEVASLRTFLASLSEGSVLPCRGRDLVAGPHWGSFVPQDTWEYGFCVVEKHYCRFLWKESGRFEQFPIQDVDFRRLVQFVLPRPDPLVRSFGSLRSSYKKVVVISHGFSPSVGPNYSIIRMLENVALQSGWTPVVPNFVESYKLGSQRGRSERVKILYEELLCLPQRPDRIALVGHSQGGAASCLGATQRVIENQNVVGLMLVGAEPITDGRDGTPPLAPAFPNKLIRILHAVEDEVIPFASMLRLGRYWSVPVMSASSAVKKGTTMFGDDVAHDFLAHELVVDVKDKFEQFLRDCSRSPDDSMYLVSVSKGVEAHFVDSSVVVVNPTAAGMMHLHLGHGILLSILFQGVHALSRLEIDCGPRTYLINEGVQRLVRIDDTKPLVPEGERCLLDVVRGTDLIVTLAKPLQGTAEVIVSWRV